MIPTYLHEVVPPPWRDFAKLDSVGAPKRAYAVEPLRGGNPPTTLKVALSARALRLLWDLNRILPDRVDAQGRIVWVLEEPVSSTKLQWLDALPRASRKGTSPIYERTSDYRRAASYEDSVRIHTIVADPSFGHWLTYPTKDDLRAAKAAAAPKVDQDMNEAERQVRASRDRNALADFTIRTCPACFRDIKATDGTIADHGFTIQRGYRKGSCSGVGQRPFEVSPQGTAREVGALLRMRVQLQEKIKDLQDPRELFAAQRALDMLDGDGFGSWRWLTAAVQDWQPSDPNRPAVGAPRLTRARVQRVTLEDARRLS